MNEKRKKSVYFTPHITITLFKGNDCISTSSDIDFGTEDEWSENIPGGGWT